MSKEHYVESLEAQLRQALLSDDEAALNNLWGELTPEFKSSFVLGSFLHPESFIKMWKKLSKNEKIDAFMLAFKTSHRQFLELFADTIYKNENLLFRVFEFSDVSCVRFFVEKYNLDINKLREPLGVSLSQRACTNPHLEVIKYLCEEKNAESNVRNERGWDGFLLACGSGSRAVVEYLCRAGKANPSASYVVKKTSESSTTPLQEATLTGNLPVIQYLVDECAVAFSSNMLNLAAYRGHKDVVDFFCKKMGTAIYQTDKDGCHVLHFAAQGGHEGVLEVLFPLLVERIHDRTTNDSHALHFACKAGHLNVVKSLYAEICRATPDFDFQMTRQSDGRTPLQLACEKGHVDVAQFLFEKLYNKIDLDKIFRLINSVGPVVGIHDGQEIRMAPQITCHEKVKPLHYLFELLHALRNGDRRNSALYFTIMFREKDIQLIDRILLRNVFAGSSKTERAYQLTEEQKNILVRCMLTGQIESPELRRDVWSRFLHTCFEAFNNPENKNNDSAKRYALYCAVLCLDTLMKKYPDNKDEYEEKLTLVLKYLLHKEESTESLSEMMKNYPSELQELIDKITEYFAQYKVVSSRVLPDLYDKCSTFLLAQSQTVNKRLAERIVELERENEYLKQKVAALEQDGIFNDNEGSEEEKAAPTRKRDADRKEKDETRKQVKLMLHGKSESVSHDGAVERNNSDKDFGM